MTRPEPRRPRPAPRAGTSHDEQPANLTVLSPAASAARSTPDAGRQQQRLAVAAKLSGTLAPLSTAAEIAGQAVAALHEAFHFHLAVIQRLEGDVLRVVAAAGPLVDERGFLAFQQSIHEGVNGRVARTGEPAFVPDTRDDLDYLRRGDGDPGSELSLPILVDGRIWGVMNLEEVAPHAFDADDQLLAEAVCAQVGAALHRAELSAQLETTVADTLGALVDVLEAKDEYTAQHARDVVELSQRLATVLGLTGHQLRDVHYAAILHDIGKIAIPSDILRKPAKLTDEEFEVIKTHSEVGGRLLERLPFTRTVAPLVRAIHERYDGAGYPDGLAGEAIPLGARIVGACDAFDAMISDRPYRRGIGVDAAIAELERCAGTQFDPHVVEALVREIRSAR